MRPRPQSSGSYRNYRNNVVSSSDEDDDDEEEEDKDEEQGGIKGHPVRVAQPILKNGRGRGNPFVIWVIGTSIKNLANTYNIQQGPCPIGWSLFSRKMSVGPSEKKNNSSWLRTALGGST